MIGSLEDCQNAVYSGHSSPLPLDTLFIEIIKIIVYHSGLQLWGQYPQLAT